MLRTGNRAPECRLPVAAAALLALAVSPAEAGRRYRFAFVLRSRGREAGAAHQRGATALIAEAATALDRPGESPAAGAAVQTAPPTRRRLLAARRPAAGARHVLFYDGVCGLCDRSVQFLLARDHERVLHFAPLQGPTAAAVLGRLGLGAVLPAPAAAEPGAGDGAPDGERSGDLPGAPQTMVFVRDEGGPGERAFLYSAGVLAALDAIGGGWRLVSWLRIVPAPLRDLVYRWIAAHRYRWFGRFDACKLPAPGERERFLD